MAFLGRALLSMAFATSVVAAALPACADQAAPPAKAAPAKATPAKTVQAKADTGPLPAGGPAGVQEAQGAAHEFPWVFVTGGALVLSAVALSFTTKQTSLTTTTTTY